MVKRGRGKLVPDERGIHLIKGAIARRIAQSHRH